MLLSRGISQIYHTYSEDMHPVYTPLPWLHTPRLRLGVTTVAEDIWVHILFVGVVFVGVVYPILIAHQPQMFWPPKFTCYTVSPQLDTVLEVSMGFRNPKALI